MAKPPKENDGVKVGPLTRREKQLLKRMDQDDKYDAKLARKDMKALAKNERKVIRRGSKIIKKNAASAKKEGRNKK